MKVRILEAVAGANWSAKPGDVIELPPEESAERFIAAGIAEPVAAPVEVAAVAAPETAAAPKPTARKGK